MNIDIDIDDIVHSMGSYDRKELFRALQQDGYIPENITITNDGSIELSKLYKSDDDFNVALKKLYNNGWKLTLEEENYIINLSKRFL
jgi:hypothetical protein